MNWPKTMRQCASPGCGAKVMLYSGHEFCSRHRPRVQSPRTGKTPEQMRQERQRRKRARKQAGVAWDGV